MLPHPEKGRRPVRKFSRLPSLLKRGGYSSPSSVSLFLLEARYSIAPSTNATMTGTSTTAFERTGCCAMLANREEGAGGIAETAESKELLDPFWLTELVDEEVEVEVVALEEGFTTYPGGTLVLVDTAVIVVAPKAVVVEVTSPWFWFP